MKQQKIKIYFNPKCYKCRQTLEIIEEKGCTVKIVEYLKDTPTGKELKEILQKLGLKAEQIIRKKEVLFKENFKGKTFSEEEWLKILVQNPVLIERPIVISGDKAILGRPPENVLTLIQ